MFIRSGATRAPDYVLAQSESFVVQSSLPEFQNSLPREDTGTALPEDKMKFFARSLLILFALYALLFAIGDAYLAKIGAPPLVAVAFVIVLAAVQYLIAPWMIEWILDIQWEEYGAQLPARNREFIEQLCAQRGLKVPRIGIIDSGTPNAFSFGRVRKDARVVVTSGLLDVLTPEESNAVLAH